VSDWRHDRRLHDQTLTRCSVPEVQRPNHGSGSCTGSRTRKSQTMIDELNTHTIKPTIGNELKPSRGTIYNLVLPKKKGWHHRSVLGEVTRTKDGHSKNLTRTRNVPPKCNKQVTTKQQTRFSLTSIN
jgi:hypothetical protein